MASQCRFLFYLLAALSGIVSGEAIAYRSLSIAWFWPCLFFLSLPILVYKRGLLSKRAGIVGTLIAISFCVYTASTAFISIEALTLGEKQGLSTFHGTLEAYTTYDHQVHLVIRLDDQNGACLSLFSQTPIADPLGTHGVVTASLRPIQRYFNQGGSDSVREAWRQGIAAEGELKSWQADRKASRLLTSHAFRFGHDFLLEIRQALTHLNQSEGQAFLSAMIFGEMSAIPREIREQWKRMGIYHLVVVSGLHLMIFYGMGYLLVYGVTYFIPRVYHVKTRQDWAMLSGSAMSLIPCFLYPQTASLSRGLLALTLVSLLRYLRVPMNGILLASAVCLLYVTVSPAALYDLSFQLTFLCVFSIVLLAPLIAATLARLFAVSHTHRGIHIFSASLATTIGLLPLIAPLQGRLYLAGLLLNVIAIPIFVALLTPIVMISVCVFPWYPNVFQMASRVIDGVFQLLNVLYRLCDYSLPNPFSTVDSALIFSMGVLSIVVTYSLSQQKIDLLFLKRRGHVAALCCVLAFFLNEAWSRYRTDDFYMTLFDVGQGESVLLENQHETLLIDAGGSGRQIGNRVIVPAIQTRGIRSLDRVLLSHPDLDHYGGMQDVVDRLSVGAFLWTGARSRDPRFEALLETLKQKNIRLERVSSHTNDERLGQAVLHYLHPHLTSSFDLPTNSQSLVMKVVYGDFSALLTGDSDRLTELTLLYGPERDHLPSTLLKIPHHGSDTSSHVAFIDRVSPQMAWVSAGRFNRFDHPRASVLARYERRGIQIFRTDEEGEVTLRVFESPDALSERFSLSTFLSKRSERPYFPFFY